MLSQIVSALTKAAPYIKAGARGFILLMGVLNALAAVVTAILPHLPKAEPKLKPAPEPEPEPVLVMAEAESSEYDGVETAFAQLN